MADRIRDAWETFDYMRTYVGQPDAVIYTLMIKACSKVPNRNFFPYRVLGESHVGTIPEPTS